MKELSQEDVEIAVEISRSTLSKIENGTGKIDFGRLERFAKYFKVEPMSIITMENKEGVYIIGKTEQEVSEDKEDYRKTDVELARAQEKVSSLKKEISHLKQELTTSKSQIIDKEKIIALMTAEKNK